MVLFGIDNTAIYIWSELQYYKIGSIVMEKKSDALLVARSNVQKQA